MKRWLVAAVLVAPALYAVDYVAFKIRGDSALGEVRVRRMYQVREKNKKFDYYPLPAEDQTCTRTLFPQTGTYPTCWWLERHPQQVTEM